MTDKEKLEKVIKGLEECLSASCRGFKPGAYCPVTDETRNYIRDALALLKAQEPVEPIPGLWDRDIQLFMCGACGGEIGAGGIAKYCFHCGRAVKWE